MRCAARNTWLRKASRRYSPPTKPELLDNIKITRTTMGEDGPEAEEPDLVGLRDRARIAAMVYTFARINAVIQK